MSEEKIASVEENELFWQRLVEEDRAADSEAAETKAAPGDEPTFEEAATGWPTRGRTWA